MCLLTARTRVLHPFVVWTLLAFGAVSIPLRTLWSFCDLESRDCLLQVCRDMSDQVRPQLHVLSLQRGVGPSIERSWPLCRTSSLTSNFTSQQINDEEAGRDNTPTSSAVVPSASSVGATHTSVDNHATPRATQAAVATRGELDSNS